MILLEIPKMTILQELAQLEGSSPVGFSEIYAAGAKAALEWMIDRRKTPTEAMQELFGHQESVH